MMADMDGMKALGGPAYAFISMMAGTIVVLAGAVGVQWKQANKVYGYRLAERDTLRDALNASTKAQEAQTRATEERNRVTEELTQAIRDLASAFDRQNEREKLQQEHEARERSRDEVHSAAMVATISSLAEALRNNTGIVTDIRSHLSRNGVI